MMIDVNRYSFGAHLGTVASLGLLLGLQAMPQAKIAAIESLLIVATAANLESSFAIYMYQATRPSHHHRALINAAGNFAAWFLISVSFVAIVIAVPNPSWVVWLAIPWGLSLLAIIGYLTAKWHHGSPVIEIAKNVGVGCIGAVISEALGIFIPALIQ